MTEETITINVPDGMEIDHEKSTLTNIVFKEKKSEKSISWEEFCRNNPDCGGEFDIASDSKIHEFEHGVLVRQQNRDKNLIATREQAEAFLALMQLMRLRQEWIRDWKPDWTNGHFKDVILFSEEKPRVAQVKVFSQALSFPNTEMAQEFFNCFQDLILTAKPLL